jgi:pentatricopeptide repeat protein
MAVTTCSLAGRWEEALTLIASDMPELGLAPSDQVYLSGLKACARARRLNEGLGLIEQMVSTSNLPRREVMRAAIEACLSEEVSSAAELPLEIMIRESGDNQVADRERLLSELFKVVARATARSRDPDLKLSFARKAVSLVPDLAGGEDVGMSHADCLHVLQACAAAEMGPEAGRLFDSMAAWGIRPNGEAYQAVLEAGRASRDTVLMLKVLRQLHDQSVPMKSPELATAVLWAATDTRQWALGLAILQSLVASSLGYVPSVEQRQLAVRLTAGLGYGQHLEDLLKLLKPRSRGVPADICYSALELMGRNALYREAIGLLSEMKRLRMPVQKDAYRGVIQACWKAGRAFEAVDIMRRAVNEGFVLDQRAYAGVIDLAGKAGWLDEAMEGFSIMISQGVMPSDMTVTVMLGTCSRAGDWRRAMEILSKVPLFGLVQNVVMYSATIDACANGGAWQQVPQLLKEMREKNIAANLYTYSAAMKAYGRAGQCDQAFQLFQDMLAEGLVPNDIVYTALLDAFAKVGRWRDAAKVLDEVRARGIVPSVQHYTAIIDACSKANALEESFHWLEEMRAAGVRPNQVTYTAVMDACGRCGAWEEGCFLLQDMQARGEIVAPVTVMLLVDACGRKGQWPVAFYLFDHFFRTTGDWDSNNFNAIICVLDSLGLKLFGRRLYHDAFRAKKVDHWSRRYPGLMDLHYFSRPMAKLAVMKVLEDSLNLLQPDGPDEETAFSSSQYIHPPNKDLIIVTGQGKHNESGAAVLREELKAFLSEELEPPVIASDVPFNRGRLCIKAHFIKKWARENLGIAER